MAEKLNVLIGTFSDKFFSMKFDPETLTEEDLHEIHDPADRSAFFALSSNGKYLYVANEYMDGVGSVAAFKLDPAKDPEFLNAIKTGSQGPAHISLINIYGRDYVLGSGFFEGDIVVFPTADDGSLLPMSDNFRFTEGAHAHGIRPIPGTAFVLATDTMHGFIYTYELNKEGKLIERFRFEKPGLEAPRHMTFSKDGKRVFVLTERTSTLEVFSIDRETGELTHKQSISNIPEDFKGDSSSAAIHISPDGKYVYCSNRGHNSLTVYDVTSDPVKKVGYADENINWPREFLIDPKGNFILVGNQEEQTVSVFKIDKETGIPKFTGRKIKLSEGPASFIFVP